MKRIIASNVVKHLDSNGLMYDLQHYFRERRSCETQLISLIEDLARKTSQGKQTDIMQNMKLFLKKLNFSHVWAKQSTFSKAKLFHAVTVELKDSCVPFWGEMSI